MPSLREEIVQAFPDEPVPPGVRESLALFEGGSWKGQRAEDVRSQTPELKRLSPEAFAFCLPAFMLASLDDPMEGDPIPAIIIAEVPRRAGALRALAPAQRRVVAKYIATMAGDHELTKGHLLKALTALR